MKTSKKVIAVSGGPDSMFLLNWCMNEYGIDNIVVVSVNYKTRKNSDFEIELVKKYCQKNNIIFESIVCDKQYAEGNFENWARNQRYDFFKSIYIKYNCDLLILGHHKDDFIETAQMQLESNRFPDFLGIKSINLLKNMNIYRPFVNKYFKEEIVELVQKNNIPFCIDESNFDTKFKRNLIRDNNRSLSKQEKENIYQSILEKNKQLTFEKNEVDREYNDWKNSFYTQDFFQSLKYKKRLIYKYIHTHFNEVKLSSSKLESIIEWYLSKNRTSSYLLKKDLRINKKSGKLLN
ncbi:tRNA lysidine(34) synthetase TilS [Mycoplasma sp. HS2188]|uniref:tRNA lysidine(34) synthetase TilS n=1 Tax=Mycoplasma sp. HS2188 TaxID=2976765 RepID=UPI0021A9CBED|nr:tRNA lysidine(34) synthetase TilS [Mycoplasma sp. HS2188]MCT4469569.1 tRNA lysidine(34) synthetase TilS [Mycoplasma sp. HS2188]